MAKLPNPKQPEHRNKAHLYPNFPAILPTSAVFLYMSGSESRLLSAFHVKRYEKRARKVNTANAPATNPATFFRIRLVLSSISEKYDRKFFPDFFFAGLGSVFRFCISDILLRCYFLLFFILLFFILIMFRDF